MRLARGHHRDVPVYSVTSVRRPLAEDVHDRMVRYLVSMTIRTACFVAMAFTDGWVMWALAAGAIVLPYVAVVLANAGRERPEPATAVLNPEVPLLALEAGPTAAGAPPSPRSRTSHPPAVVLPEGGYLR